MKWFFRSITLTLLVFILFCVLGAFMPAQQRVDVSANLKGDVHNVYEIISDLRSYSEWSGIGGLQSEWVFGGADVETGQTAAWDEDGEFGFLEILQAEPGRFVVLKMIEDSGEHTISLALSESEVGTNFLIEGTRELGGFPYFSRIASMRQKITAKQSLMEATQGLAEMVEP